jgi:orotidine-5'-phosphate decarboxylase
MSHFADRLIDATESKRSHVMLGLDPDYDSLPAEIRSACPREAYGSDEEMKADCFRRFLGRLLEAVRDDVIAVKPQIAYFEALGSPGYALYLELVALAQQMGYLVVADVKRGDIGSTAEAYARAHLDLAGADALTVNPYLGTDGLEPFFSRSKGAGKGVFVLVKTSNPSSADIQDVVLSTGETVYRHVANLVNEWGAGSEGTLGYRAIGAVVGGTHPQQGVELRALLKGVPLLVPGYGAQGAKADDLRGFFDERGLGAVVNSARAILYAYKKRPEVSWTEAAVLECREMKAALWKAAGR